MLDSNKPWIVLFGGAHREQSVIDMVNLGEKVECVLSPIAKTDKLRNSIDRLREQDINVLCLNRFEIDTTLEAHGHCALLSIGFPYIIPSAILHKFNPAINVHPTLLPKYRGATSGAYVILNNEKYAGSTVHFLTKDLDAGRIIAQSKVSLDEFDTTKSMQMKVYASESNLIQNALKSLRQGSKGVPQNEFEASSFLDVRKPADSQIDPSQSLLSLYDEIRAADAVDYPAHFYLSGEKINVKLWRETKFKNDSKYSI
jgi:methionyl-tRNA formyltransferase